MAPTDPVEDAPHPTEPDATTPAPTGTAPAPDRNGDPDEISIGKVIQGKKPPSSTKFAALGYLLGREPQPLQDPGKSRRAARRTHHRSIPWYNFMAAPAPSELMRTLIPHP